MKLNMGCGHNRMEGFINVDSAPECAPDVVLDLEQLPWPWPDDTATVVMFNHSLEHIGRDPRVFLAMIKELYRICRDGAQVHINVPHPRHDDFINDPTHVRPITPALLTLFDHDQNDQWQRDRAANSPLAHYLHVDFKVTKIETVLAEPYATQFEQKQIGERELDAMTRELNNIACEYRIVMTARKQRSW